MKRYRDRGSVEERFEKYVEPEPTSGCHLWVGCRDAGGYGHIGIWDRATQTRNDEAAHRVAYRLYRGLIPAGMQICHRCDNPPCVNPAHLFLGTNEDNVADKVRKGRQARQVGEEHGCAKLTRETVLEIHRRASSGESCYSLAREYGIRKSQANRIANKKTWTWLFRQEEAISAPAGSRYGPREAPAAG